MALLHTTTRCNLIGSDILQSIDNSVGKIGTTRIRTAEKLFSSALGETVKIWFDGDMLCAQLPINYVKACQNNGQSEEQIIRDCLTHGLHQWEAMKKSG